MPPRTLASWSAAPAGWGHPTAELTWGLILALLRSIPREDGAVRKGVWQTGLGVDLNGKVLGLLGLGRLGSRVAAVGKAFGMSLIAWSQNLTSDVAAQNGAELVSKDDLFARSDVLSVHLVLSARTRGLAGERELGLMKPTAYLINTSRGLSSTKGPSYMRSRPALSRAQASMCSMRSPCPETIHSSGSTTLY